MPIGFVRLWKGIDVSKRELREANWLPTRIQELRNGWLSFRLKCGLFLKTAKVVVPPNPQSDAAPVVRDAHAVRMLLHKLSQDIGTKDSQYLGREAGPVIAALGDVRIKIENPNNLAALLDPAFRGCRAIELQQLRQNIEILYKHFVGVEVHADNRVWLVEIHKQLDRFLMVEKRYGHSDLGVVEDVKRSGNSELVKNPGRRRTDKVGDGDKPIRSTEVTGRHQVIEIGRSIPSGVGPGETRIPNPFLPENSSEERREPDGASPFGVFHKLADSGTGHSIENPAVGTTFSEVGPVQRRASVPLVQPSAKQSSSPIEETLDEDDGAGSSGEDSEDLSDSSSGVGTASRSANASDEAIRRNGPQPLIEAAPVGQPVTPARAAPAGAIWTANMTEERRRELSQQYIDDLFLSSTRLQLARPQTRGPALKNCFQILNKLTDPGLAPYRSESLEEGLKSSPLLQSLNEAIGALRMVINDVPREKKAQSQANLNEWVALVTANAGLARPVPDPGIIFKSAVTVAIGQADFDGA